MSEKSLKVKLKSVGINITKLTKSGKRKPLTLNELKQKDKMFKKLQERARKLGLKLKYKSRTGGLKSKSYKRLSNEINRHKHSKKQKFGS